MLSSSKICSPVFDTIFGPIPALVHWSQTTSFRWFSWISTPKSRQVQRPVPHQHRSTGQTDVPVSVLPRQVDCDHSRVGCRDLGPKNTPKTAVFACFSAPETVEYDSFWRQKHDLLSRKSIQRAEYLLSNNIIYIWKYVLAPSFRLRASERSGFKHNSRNFKKVGKKVTE